MKYGAQIATSLRHKIYVLSICVAMLMKVSVVGIVPEEEKNGFVDPFLSIMILFLLFALIPLQQIQYWTET